MSNELLDAFKGWYRFNDAAHQPDHVDAVLREIEEVVRPVVDQFTETIDWDAIKLSVVAHDLFAAFREDHEKLAYHFVKRVSGPVLGSKHLTETLALAAMEHRASRNGKFSSLYSEIVATADKPFVSIEETVVRAYKYAVSKMNLTHDQAVEHVQKHLGEKFGRNGYAKYPRLWMTIHKDKLEENQFICDTIMTSEIERYVERTISPTTTTGSVLPITEKDLSDLYHWLEMAAMCMYDAGIAEDEVIVKIVQYIRDCVPVEFQLVLTKVVGAIVGRPVHL